MQPLGRNQYDSEPEADSCFSESVWRLHWIRVELPGANTQGATLAEARVNLQEAVALVL